MPPRKQTGPRGMCTYLVEVQDRDGITSVPDEFTYLVKKCIEDKVFSENGDHITVCRTDSTSSGMKFGLPNWEELRKGLKLLSSTEVVGAENPINCIENIVAAMRKQAKEDSYDVKKILYFADLSSYILDKDELVNVAEKLLANGIFISIVLPNKVTMNDLQIQNSKLLKTVFDAERFEEISALKSLGDATKQIVNTLTKKLTRPNPWNCPLEVAPGISFNVSGYLCTRKNNMNAMTRVLMSQVPAEPESQPSTTQGQLPSTSSSARNQLAVQRPDDQTVVEVAKEVLEKEQVWTDNEGNVVEEEDIGKAYYFGDKLIPFNEVESEDSYKSGPKCLKVLLFCPRENINLAFHAGDGTTLFYPKKDDVVIFSDDQIKLNHEAEVMLKALIEAMENTNRVAVVRKVYLKDKKVTVGTLVPDMERQCLVFTELSFADDISIPQLPLLIRREELANNDTAETNEKEDLIDELIKSRTLDAFSPSEAPADPAVFALRELFSKKFLGDSAKSLEPSRPVDNLSVFFQNVAGDSSNVLLQIENSFPLTANKIESERLAGKNVFRKRELEAPVKSEEVDKKPKLEAIDNEADEIEQPENDDIDDLLDEL